MILIKQNGQVYEISFRYDPTIVQLIKQVPQKQWVSESKHWTIPVAHLGLFLNQLKGTMYEDQVKIESDEHLGENQEIEHSTPIPRLDVSQVPLYVKKGGKLYDHQIDFMRWAIYREAFQQNFHGFILADQMGAGKSLETMNLAIYNKFAIGFKRCLIICCVNTAKYHWYDDIKEHSQGKFIPYILGTRKKRNGSYRSDTGTKEKLEDLETGHMYGDISAPELPFFIIMNVEGVRAKQGKKFVIADQIIDWCNRNEISMIAVDEIHKGCSPSSTQGKQLDRIDKQTNGRVMWIPITGTPITSRPTDVYLPLKLVKGHMYTSFWKWCQKFCIYGGFGGHEIIGYRNIPYLKSLLEPNMIRRLKKDILDLPEKIHYTEYVEVTPYQNRLYSMEVNNMVANRSEIIKSLNPLSQFMHLRQICESPELYDDNVSYEDSDYCKKNSKLQRLLELVEEIHERGEKVVIFDNWVQPLHMLYYHLSKKYNVCVYTGTMSDEDRNHNKEVFMKNPKYTIILGTIGALGTMHTLTTANNVIFYGEPWTAADKEQAEDRCHRISTTKNVNIYTLLAKGTVEERVHNIVYRKEGISNYIVDNIDIHSNPELFDLLLSDTIKTK